MWLSRRPINFCRHVSILNKLTGCTELGLIMTTLLFMRISSEIDEMDFYPVSQFATRASILNPFTSKLKKYILPTFKQLAVARNLCAVGQGRGAPETPVSRGVWGHAPPENFEI